jgi:glucose dehydrogenase
VSRLTQAWSFDTGATDLQVTPIVVDGLLYVTAGSRVIALAPETGTPVWTHDAPGEVSRRGVAYWPGDANTPPRLFTGAGDGRMTAIDARSGALVTAFGEKGFVDLKASVRGGADGRLLLNAPPVVYRDVVITGGANAEGEPSRGLYGDIRGWDARSGRLLWSFHTVPRAGEPGVDTWEGDSWKDRSGTNAWTYMTVDVDRGLVFAATGSPTSDFYGADRRGKNLYANSVVALDAGTGRLRWHQQLVHHDIWDWDLPAAPTLVEVRRDGRTVPAVAQITKMSTLFIFDRVTGEPLFGVEEMPVPQSDVPGEATWPTQPFPVKPPPLARTSFDPATDFYALTPEHAAWCRDLWDTHKMYTHGIFTPAAVGRTMVMFPSTLGGGNWSGLSYDPGRGLVFTNIMNLGQVGRMERRDDPKPGEMPFKRTSPWGSAYGRFWNPDTRMPCSAPPFGELVAVDVNTAAVAWRVPLGRFDELAARGYPDTGAPNIGGTIATASGVIFVGATIDGRFRAFDARTGARLWETTLPASAHATPMTYLGRDGRQYVVIAATGNGILRSKPGTTIVAFVL